MNAKPRPVMAKIGRVARRIAAMAQKTTGFKATAWRRSGRRLRRSLRISRMAEIEPAAPAPERRHESGCNTKPSPRIAASCRSTRVAT